MPLEFSPGDRVHLSPSAIDLYGGVWRKWTPEGQGGGTPGTILEANENRPHDTRAAARPYIVRWDNGVVNSYREDDLESEADAIMRLARTRTEPITNPKIVMFSTPK